MASIERAPLPTIDLLTAGWSLRGWRACDAAALARHADNPQATRIFAPIHAGNQRSMRVAEKNGFALEGVQRRSAIKDGRVIDRWIWARYRE